MWEISTVKGTSFAVFSVYLAMAILKIAMGIYVDLSAIELIGYYSLFVCIIGSARIFGPQIVSHFAEKDHPYGYKKYGSLISLFVALMFILFGLDILKTLITAVSVDSYYGFYSFVLATVLIAIMLDILILKIKNENDSSEKNEIFNISLIETDLLLSVVVAGILISGTIYPLAELLVVFLIVAFLFKECTFIIVESSNTLCDACRLDETAVRRIVNSIDGVENCYMVRAHGASQSIFVDLHVKVMSDMHIRDSQRVVRRIENELKRTFRGVSDVFVHIEPL
ncbi:cation diffusion facilitator family transporter [Methanococcoides vulcani]|uniref:Cation diffusion facilitator family transporter n=1 Tax=Methanococcoides vulcani TaxID=1353158 RepID=A0A1I0B4X5_9EURY|nr:cation diffusion facilitator family transporter [Methanococcoides vulcani]SET01913.1 cation diffusion facilitator family transporter [Methanococcoides vulcani]